MHTTLTMMEMTELLLVILFSWWAGNRAYRLPCREDTVRLRAEVRKLLWRVGLISVVDLAVIGCIVTGTLEMEPIFWLDRAMLHVPLMLLPLLAIWLFALPALLRLRQMAATGEAGAIRPEMRAIAAAPRMIMPFRMMTLGALFTFYFVLVPPVPFRWYEAAIPLALLLVACGLLWMRHDRRREKATRPEATFVLRPWPIRALTGIGLLAVVWAGAAPFFIIAKNNSRLPDRLDMTQGVMDYGTKGEPSGLRAHDHAAHSAIRPVSVTDLTGPITGKPDRQFTLTAEKKTIRLASGKTVDAWTYNGQIPGPELRMKNGELVEVTLINKNIDAGVTIHWHGLDVPNAEDGVAGATQDAVMPGESYTYRFRAEQTGTFWYHSHQHSNEAVQKGLFGALIVEPNDPAAARVKDITVLSHTWDEAGLAIGSSEAIEKIAVAPGTPVRLRLIHTDDWVRQSYDLTGTKFQVAAIDGTELNEPDDLENVRLWLTTGGRYDVTFTMPNGPVFLRVGREGNHGVFMSPDGTGDIPEIPNPSADFEPQRYGKPTPTPFGPDSKFDREFMMILDNKLGFYNGELDMNYTINGEVFPNTPMFMVREGELVKTTIVNRGHVDHPVHLHGHHMLVMSRNGERVSGSPWWSDTLDVASGETYEVAFLANNPGLWMDHCHNLDHAAGGMTMHLMYEGVASPFTVGNASHNHPE